MVYSQKPLTLCVLGAIEKAYPLRREVWGYIPSDSEFFWVLSFFLFSLSFPEHANALYASQQAYPKVTGMEGRSDGRME